MKLFVRSAFIPTLLLALLFAGCSSSKNFYLEEQYEQNKQNTPVMIVPIKREYFPGTTTHEFGYLNSEQEFAFTTSLGQSYSRFAGVPAYTQELDSSANENLQKRTMELSGGSFETFVPREGAQLPTQQSGTGFVLLLDQFRYMKQSVTVQGSGYAGHEQSAQYTLVFETKYLYWDTRSREAAGWGTARASIDLEGSVATQAEYSEVLSRVMEDIARRGPVRGSNTDNP